MRGRRAQYAPCRGRGAKEDRGRRTRAQLRRQVACRAVARGAGRVRLEVHVVPVVGPFEQCRLQRELVVPVRRVHRFGAHLAKDVGQGLFHVGVPLAAARGVGDVGDPRRVIRRQVAVDDQELVIAVRGLDARPFDESGQSFRRAARVLGLPVGAVVTRDAVQIHLVVQRLGDVVTEPLLVLTLQERAHGAFAGTRARPFFRVLAVTQAAVAQATEACRR